LTRADQAQHIECGEQVTTTDAEIVQSASNLHDQISHAICGQAQDIFDNPTAFDPGKHVFHDHTRTGEQVIAAIVQPDPNMHFSGWRLVSMMCTRPRRLESMAPERAHCVYGIYALT